MSLLERVAQPLQFDGFPPATVKVVREWLPAALTAIKRRTGRAVAARTIYAMTDKEIAADEKHVEPGNPLGGGHGRNERDGTVKVNPRLSPYLTLLNVIHELGHGELPDADELEMDRVTKAILKEIGADALDEEFETHSSTGKQTRPITGLVPLPLGRTPKKGEVINPEMFEGERPTTSLRDLVESDSSRAYRDLARKAPEFKVMKKHKVPLTPEERELCMDREAVWNFHFGRDGKRQKTPAVWKAVLPDGTTWFNTNTHCAWNVASTLKSGIKRYHDFIKGTS